MPDNSTAVLATSVSPKWDRKLCSKLLNKPILCEQYVHQDFASCTHYHIGFETIFCMSGAGFIYFNGRPFAYEAPVLVQIHGSNYHNVVVRGTYDRWNVCIEPNTLVQFLHAESRLYPVSVISDELGISMAQVPRPFVHRLENIFVDVAAELSERPVDFELITMLKLQELSCMFKRFISDTGAPQHVVNASISKTQVEQLLHIRSYVDANLANEISAHTIAKEFHYSEKYVYRLVQQLTGFTLGNYLKHQRILHAKQLLETTTLPVSAVGSAVGISHPVQFSRVFRELTGSSPTEYRLQHQL